MKADWGLLGGAAAAMLALPLLVLAWSGTPLGTGLPGGTTSDPTPQQSNILPGTDREEPEEPPADTFSVLPSFRILDETTGQVAEIPAADYVAGAIAAEMPASYEEDALIAQGMAAYTNAHYLAALRRADPPEELNGADFSADPSKRLGYITDDTMKAMWGDHYKAYRKKITKAAEKAMRYLITYEGQPIVAAYFAISAGKTTEDAGNVWEGPLPYLTPADSHWDKEAAGYRSTVTITAAELRKKLTAQSILTGQKPEEWLKVLTRSEAGYVTAVQAGDRVLTGQQLRTVSSQLFGNDYEQAIAMFYDSGERWEGCKLPQSCAHYFMLDKALYGFFPEESRVVDYSGACATVLNEDEAAMLSAILQIEFTAKTE